MPHPFWPLNSLDEPEVLPGDLPEVLQGAGPSAELVVGVVLRQHDSAAACAAAGAAAASCPSAAAAQQVVVVPAVGAAAAVPDPLQLADVAGGRAHEAQPAAPAAAALQVPLLAPLVLGICRGKKGANVHLTGVGRSGGIRTLFFLHRYMQSSPPTATVTEQRKMETTTISRDMPE